MLLDQLAIKTALLLGANGPQMSTPPVYGGLQSGSAFGTRVEITQLGPAHPVGSVPSSGDMGSSVWRRLNRRRVGGGSASYYIKGHLLNEQLGGPGNTWQNLTPLTREGNADHFERFERAVKAAVNGSSGDYDPRVALAGAREAVRFIVTANYVQRDTAVARSHLVTGWADKPQAEKDAILDVMRAEASVPETLTCTAEGTNFRMSSSPSRTPWTARTPPSRSSEAGRAPPERVPARPSLTRGGYRAIILRRERLSSPRRRAASATLPEVKRLYSI